MKTAASSIQNLWRSKQVRKTVFMHGCSIVFVSLLFLAFLMVGGKAERGTSSHQENHDILLMLKDYQFNDPLQKALFRDTYTLYHPSSKTQIDSLMQTIEVARMEEYANKAYKSGSIQPELTWDEAKHLLEMYGYFLLIYLLVLLVSSYAIQTLALIRFIHYKQHRASYIVLAWDYGKKYFIHFRTQDAQDCLNNLAKAMIKGCASLIFFAPAYIIAYALNLSYVGSSWIFMILLGIISNGFLVNYAHKLSVFLFSESKKGYVETAVVKGLNRSFVWDEPDGISRVSIVRLTKNFPSHILQHIFLNARYQYIPTIKQYASFLITGLVIIEMALNVQGHLCYELLQDVMNHRYQSAAAIIWGIFLVVKGTELLIDLWYASESIKYENKF